MIIISRFIAAGLSLPFIGTLLGSAFVFFMKKSPSEKLMTMLDSFAAGIMCAASFFSLISPATQSAEGKGAMALLSCSLGFFSGMAVFIMSDRLMKKIPSTETSRSGKMLMLAVSLHNIPEGMAVGVVYAGLLGFSENVSVTGALSLSIGIALQNIPEGAIISMPLNVRDKNKCTAFLHGAVSGIAELIPAVLTLFLSAFVDFILPFSLCFAAGAMFFVVLSELSEGFNAKDRRILSLFVFSLGFTVMMLLDTFLS